MFELTPYVRYRRAYAVYDPIKAMEEMENRFFGRQSPAFKTDIRETDKEYVLEAELPGFAKEDIRAEIRDGVLKIRAEKSEKSTEEAERYLRRERSYGSFSRSFSLEGILADEITASYENGILSVTLPKELPKEDTGRVLDIH